MANTKSSSEAGLQEFLEAAGRSFEAAQISLSSQTMAAPPAMAISDIDLEIKTAISRKNDGTLTLQTIGRQELVSGVINPSVVSTMRVKYVAMAPETAAAPPKRSKNDVTDTVKKQDDIVRLGKILGGLQFEPVYVPSSQRWLVTVKDTGGLLVREVVIPDTAKEP